MLSIKKAVILLIACLLLPCIIPHVCRGAGLDRTLTDLTAAHEGKSGAYVLEKGEESLLARAWLTENAETAIDVQYFIWSTDNIGTLAVETLLNAADRGVKVRVLVDDLLIDAPHDILIALALHPNAEIRIYNPNFSVGVSRLEKIVNILTNFRGVNQRMHDKTFAVDGLVGIIGGRNMADEYFDYDHHYNFRDRDILLIGPVVSQINDNFETFWQSKQAVPVEKLLEEEAQALTKKRVQEIYGELHAYAADPVNYNIDVRDAVAGMPEKIPYLLKEIVWEDIRFISDIPGKNSKKISLGGGSATTSELIKTIQKAKKRITIQSPYLVMPKGGIELFEELIKKGVQVRISTNSLAATDNLKAFSGYSKQREKLLKAGIQIFEFRPDAHNKKKLIDRYQKLEQLAPIFAIHAKTLIIDGETLFVGTYNFDPRSANLNTEVGVLIKNKKIAGEVEKNIETDMLPQNSWNPAVDDPDSYVSFSKRMRLNFYKLMPLKPLL